MGSDRSDGPTGDQGAEIASQPARGTLKLFVTAGNSAIGVRRMIDAAAARRGAGDAVAVAAIDTDAEELLDRLGEPASNIDDLLARAPQAVVIEDLARANVGPSGRAQRWHEALTLLAAGIDVLATLDIACLDSLADAVFEITGERTQQTVPDALIEDAVIEVVDTPNAQGESDLALRSLMLRRVAQVLETRGRALKTFDAAAPVEGVLVAVSGAESSEALVRSAKRLADTFAASFEAVHVETPAAQADGAQRAAAASALGLATRLGATIATVPAASVADGIAAHLETSPVAHVVLGESSVPRWLSPWRRSTQARLAELHDQMVFHIFPRARAATARTERPKGQADTRSAPRHYAYAVGLVGGTLTVALLLQGLLGARPLDLLFLFPVIAVAARMGLKPALFAVFLSVLCYNFFLLLPAYSFALTAPQNLVMSGVLVVIAVYTSVLTARIRGRLVLSDRSARENAAIASFAQRLTRVSDWESTAQAVCEQVSGLMNVETVVFRERDGTLDVAAACPADPDIGPLDRTALDWAWNRGEEAGSGTATLSAANWQFQPLKTSLGVLAVLGLAGEDGRSPIHPDQAILLSTLLSQAALAHERLRLEDALRASNPSRAPRRRAKPSARA